MILRRNALVAAALAACLTAAAGPAKAAGYLNNPDYPLNPVEQLYADLAKLSPAERQAKLEEGGKKEGQLEFIQTLGGALGRGANKVFTDAYPYIKLSATEMITNAGMERLVAEERADKHLTDVAGGDLTEASVPLDNGFLARYPTPATAAVQPQYRGLLDPHNRWIVYSWNEHGMSYNSRMIGEADAPKDWFDLCKPALRGQASIEPSRGRFLIFLHTMLGEEKMVEWLKCFAANSPIIMTGSSVRVDLMIAGDHGIQATNSLYRGLDTVRKKGADKVPFRAVWTAPIMAQPSGCVINRMAARPYAAALFCDSLLNEKTQQFLYDNFRNPVTMPSPFMPPDAQLITVGPRPVELVQHLHSLWAKHVGTSKN